MSEVSKPQVPDQLTDYIDDSFMEVHERWQSVSYDDVVSSMAEPVQTEFGRAVILDPEERDESRTVVLGLPHQQAWKPSMAIRAQYLQETVAPNSRLVVLPNNTVGDTYYSFDRAETHVMRHGDMRPYFEQRAKLLEALDISGKVDLTGYSLGAMTATGLAATLHGDRWQVGVVNADEAPNAQRTGKQLEKDFMKSGGPVEQWAAIKDAGVPALKSSLNFGRLSADYVRFGIAAKTDETNKTLAKSMALTGYNSLVDEAVSKADFVKIGGVEGSKVYMSEAAYYDEADSLAVVTYTGEHARLHPTGDNVAAHALMFEQAVELSEQYR